MITWIVDTIRWTYNDFILPFTDLPFLGRWLFSGEIPLVVSILAINSLFIIARLVNNAKPETTPRNSGAALIFQSGLIVANLSVVLVDASVRGWI